MAPTGNEQSYRKSSSDADTVRIHITSSMNDNTVTTHTILRSQIKTSTILLSHINASVIHIHWHGTSDVFPMYHAWLSTHNILTRSELSGQQITPPSGATTKDDYVDLICCWGMGQTLRDIVYQDTVVSSMIQRLQAWTRTTTNTTTTPPFVYALTAPVVHNIWQETAEDAPLRRLIVDAAARFGRVEDFEHFKRDPGYAVGFVKEVMVALGREKERVRMGVGVGVERELGGFMAGMGQGQIPPPPVPASSSPWTGRLPSPFFNFEAEFAAQQQQQPRSILRRSSVSGPGGGAKQVRFQGEGVDFAEDECVYHLHRQTGAFCWRAGL